MARSDRAVDYEPLAPWLAQDVLEPL